MFKFAGFSPFTLNTLKFVFAVELWTISSYLSSGIGFLAIISLLPTLFPGFYLERYSASLTPCLIGRKYGKLDLNSLAN